MSTTHTHPLSARRGRGPILVALLVVVYAATRAPIFLSGYGGDGDYWNVACVARQMLESGRTMMARAPGNPLHQLQVAASLRVAEALGVAGWWIANSVTVLWGLLLLALVDAMRARVGIPRPWRGPLLGWVALLPIFWAHSADGADHVPAAALTLASIFLLLPFRRRGDSGPARFRSVLIAGALLGAAAGFRVGSLAFVPAAALALLARGGGRRSGLGRICLFAAAMGLVLAAEYWSIFQSYGMLALSPAQRPFGPLGRLARLVLRGSAALLPGLVLPGALFLVARSRRARLRLARLALRPSAVELTLLSGLAASCVLFAWLPLDPAYLLPAAICFIALAARIASPRQMSAAALLAACAAVVDVSPVAVGEDGVRLDLVSGRVVEQVREGRLHRDYPGLLIDRGFPQGSLVVLSRNLMGARAEEFAPVEIATRGEGERTLVPLAHPGAGDVWFVGFRSLLGAESRAVLCAENRRLWIDARAIDRAQRETHDDLLAAVSSWPRPVEVFSF